MKTLKMILTNEEIEIIKKERDLIKKADILVSRIFEGKMDKERVAYINHLYYVKDHVSNYYEKVIALLHDTVEDTPLTLKDLKYLGFPDLVINSVDLLTHRKILKDKNEDYLNYVKKILSSNNMFAINVKKADMEHNMNKERMNRLDKEVRNYLLNKYEKPYELINNYVKEKER